MLDRRQRIAVFLDRLGSAAPAASHDEAFELLRRTLTAVEDELSGVPDDPDNYLDNGRLYPPRQDSRRKVPGRPDLVRYRSKGHNTWIGLNGAIRIEELSGKSGGQRCCLDKPGKDGRTVRLE
ncbi:hypothetical protein QA635_33915 [Bradyrhizobium brasilense]|uniref:hypothetical protein n=1 Tax=Bradyrhizobium brasilense TaxID=1419277 RepID=UPI0024B085E1|nr:hypothetical protein [Bradyrhizobium australafricanum]WFU31480.1 hypothetical protein QA635_33915 [Bradyrhizobium australafricanum]